MISTMKTMFQTGLNEHVPVPPEKGFLIHLRRRFVVIASQAYEAQGNNTGLLTVDGNPAVLFLWRIEQVVGPSRSWG